MWQDFEVLIEISFFYLWNVQKLQKQNMRFDKVEFAAFEAISFDVIQLKCIFFHFPLPDWS